jgi:hypothetical protein
MKSNNSFARASLIFALFTQAAPFANAQVFYHDNGYDNPTTKETYADFTGGIQKNFCGIQGTKNAAGNCKRHTAGF